MFTRGARRRSRRLRMVLVVALLALAAATGSASAAPPNASCTPQCKPPLVKIGGANAVTQASPTVFLIFWGPNWNDPKFKTHDAVKTANTDLFQALAGNASAAAGYNSIFTQYLGAGNNVPNYGGSWIDTTPPPAALQASDFQGEVDRAIGQNEGWFAGKDVQFVIYPSEKTTGGRRVVVSFAGEEKPDFCGYHDFRTEGTVNGTEIFDVEPFLGHNDPCLNTYGSGAGSTRVVRAMTTVATHEYAEAATDPFWDSATGKKGWQTNQNDLFEIGDLCVYPGVVKPGLGAVQYLWSNRARDGRGGCVTSN